jgi:hypothetical protein
MPVRIVRLAVRPVLGGIAECEAASLTVPTGLTTGLDRMLASDSKSYQTRRLQFRAGLNSLKAETA